MCTRLGLLIAVSAVAGCNISVPNGLFSCGQPSDCPVGFFCWSSDSRCYDAKEPSCEPKTCDEVIAEFGELGILVECGSLPDGCDGTVDCGGCPDGAACGANGQNFVCGCEENTCANFAGGAECGVVPTRCGGAEQAIYCGSCIGNSVCVDNKCVCPDGVDCSNDCPGGEPTYPCSTNDCSPPGGLPNGCGGVAHCPPCDVDQDCVLSNELRYECLGECTCEAQGIECGNATVCGAPTACGSCSDNGFDQGFRCQDGACVCEDEYELNEDPSKAALVCAGGAGVNCMQEAWSIDFQASLHASYDVDFYEIQAMDSRTQIVVEAYNGQSDRRVYAGYICPDGSSGIGACSGSQVSIQGYEFCMVNGDFVGIARNCSGGGTSLAGTVLVGVEAREFAGDCDGYGLKITATYQEDFPWWL